LVNPLLSTELKTAGELVKLNGRPDSSREIKSKS
jgi:hypothetical protein